MAKRTRAFYRDYQVGPDRRVRAMRSSFDDTIGVYREYRDGGQILGIIRKVRTNLWIVTGYPGDPQKTLADAVAFIAKRMP